MTARIPALTPERATAIRDAYAEVQRAKRLRTLGGLGILIALCLVAAGMAEVSPTRFAEGIPRFFDYFSNLVPKLSLATFWADLGEWYWGLKRWTRLLIDTILIAYTGTIIGALVGGYLSFVAAGSLNRVKWLVFVTRRLLEFCRTVPEIVFALIFIVAFGLGPLPGVMAIALHTIGALGKLFSEVNENASLKPVEGVIATGGGWHAAMIFGVLPQVLPNFVSYALLRFEVNIRGAAVMGFVGAGGIGQELVTAIRQFYYSDISAILLMIIATVMVVDILTEKLRHAIIGREGH
ncbi:MAG: phosphonate ABC transporter, permease protein PhnE [Gemmobacter sp.]|uniref:phosphonate ABC transporter, permease protein PhnE n=1 Tax=Gemmobacter sp. TaxID=1898957 RepID=UPI00391DB74B